VVSHAFGETRYQGRIGLLHIDGNHDYGHVLADTQAWAPFVQPGGWIIFDDYEWDWGDGPRRVADHFMANNPIQARFLVAGALFIQRGG
jgi:cephalosporin hydroxylase